jgi:hypothetical protein
MKRGCWIVAVLFSAGLLASGIRADEPDGDKASTGVTLITINAHNMTPKETLDEIGKQAHVSFGLQGEMWNQQGIKKTIDVDLTNKPFWSAVDQVCEDANLQLQTNFSGSTSSVIMVSPLHGHQKAAPLPMFESQGLRVKAVSFNRNQTINFANPEQAQDNCSIQVAVYADPAMKISSLSQAISVTEALDDAGHSFLPEHHSANLFSGGVEKSLIYQRQVPLTYPDGAGKKMSSLKFSMEMTVSDETDSLSIDKPLEAEETTKNFGDVSVTFHSLKKISPGTYELKIGLTSDKQHGGNMFAIAQSAELLDAEGHAFRNYGGGGGGGRTVEYSLSYVSGNGDNTTGDPARWVVELPTKSHTVTVPVEFKDLPLP